MGLDAAFQSSTDAVLLDMAQRPRPPVKQTPAFSTWGLVKAAPRGALSGLSQAIGSAADVLEGAAQVQGSLGQDDWMMPNPGDAARQTEEARKRLKEQGGPTYNSDVGRSFRNVGRDYMPDPVTSHGAEQAVANLFRVGVKAVTAGAVLGPVGGAVAAGAEEGFSTADDLREQGVDLATRTKVGAVTAAFTAGSFALPVAGQTWKATAGLAVAGGPASFIGQNAATREILNNADYGSIANQYDPFDPVGLTLSTLLPLGFGALAMRGARGAKAAGEPVKPGEAPVSEPVAGPRPDVEAVDSARVNLLRENIDNTRPTPVSDLAGGAAHDAAMARAIDQMAAGERVAVSDVVSQNAFARIADELEPRITRALDEIGPPIRALEQRMEPVRPEIELMPGPGGVVEPARATVVLPDGESVHLKRDFRGKYIAETGDGTRIGGVQYTDMPTGGFRVTGVDVRPEFRRRGVATAIYDFLEQRVIKQTLKASGSQSADGAAFRAARAERAAERATTVAATESSAAPGVALKLVSESPEVDRASNLIEAEQPDMLVHLEGQDAPVPLGELMKRVREELGRDLQEAPLIEAAAACFVSSGG